MFAPFFNYLGPAQRSRSRTRNISRKDASRKVPRLGRKSFVRFLVPNNLGAFAPWRENFRIRVPPCGKTDFTTIYRPTSIEFARATLCSNATLAEKYPSTRRDGSRR